MPRWRYLRIAAVAGVRALRTLGARPTGEPRCCASARDGWTVDVTVLAGDAARGGVLATADRTARRRHLVLRPDARCAWRHPGEHRALARGAGRDLRSARLPERDGRGAQPPADEARAGPVDARGAASCGRRYPARRAPSQPGRVAAGTWCPPSPTSRQVVFLTDGGAISYAESVMGYVEALGLDIVGGPTAGTNGNVRRVNLPPAPRCASLA